MYKTLLTLLVICIANTLANTSQGQNILAKDHPNVLTKGYHSNWQGLQVDTLPSIPNEEVWPASPSADYHQAVVKISSETGYGSAFAYACKEGRTYFITARHVLQSEDPKLRLIHNRIVLNWTISNNLGRAGGVQIEYLNPAADIAVFSVVCPAEMKVTLLELSNEPATEYGEILEVCGWGGRSVTLRHFHVPFRAYTRELSGCEGLVVQGDSGGPVVNKKQQVVGIVNGGMSFCNVSVEMSPLVYVRPVWPVMFVSLNRLLGSIQKAANPTETDSVLIPVQTLEKY